MKNNRESTAILVIVLIVLLLAGVALMCFFGGKDYGLKETEPEQSAEETAEPAAESEQAAEPEPAAGEEPEEQSYGVDYDAMYALHDPDEVVMTIDGHEVLWKDYFYLYHGQASSMEEQFQMYQYYGLALGWESEADEEGHSYAELLGPTTEQTLRRVITVESVAKEYQVSLNEEEEKAVQEEHLSNISYFCGENGSEEQLFEQLQEMYLSPEFYWRIMRFGALSQAELRSLYGEEGEKLDEQEVLAWMQEQGILSANHILIATMDLSTYQPLDEATIEEKTALAAQIAQELQAIDDPEAREARFLELKEQYCEDGGDYVFGPGVMVDEFYDGTLALEEGQVSDPILSQFGYHIILRRPIHADDVVFTANGDQSARSMMVDSQFSQMMQERMDKQQVEYAPGFETPDILAFYTKPSYAS